MKVNELRIGNYVDIKHDEYECESYQFDFESGWNMEYINPILLTEEWLLKFNYELNGGCYYQSIFTDIEFFLSNGKLFCELFGNSLINIEYVHDLQNLHFAIYKEELTIK